MPQSNLETETVTRTYAKPGTYSKLMEVVDANGHVARDSAIVHVVDAAHPEAPYPSLHVPTIRRSSVASVTTVSSGGWVWFARPFGFGFPVGWSIHQTRLGATG
jgi:hypothetical protein